MPATPAIQSIIGDIGSATKSVLGLNDNLGQGMGCLKVIPDPGSKGYLAVYGYGSAQIGVATSTDLVHWTFRAQVDVQATQPYITALTDGGFLVSSEFNNGHGGQVRIVYFASRAALLAGMSKYSVTIPRSLSSCNEGTPNIYNATLAPDILHSVIDVGHHYHWNCDRDREARGTLTNLSSWKTSSDDVANNAVMAGAVQIGAAISGNIGARDNFEYDGAWYNLIEAQYTKGDFGTWNLYLLHWLDETAEEIEMTSQSGPLGSIGNPRVTNLIGPSGRPAVVVTGFMFDPQVGPSLWYREYTPDPSNTPAYRAMHNSKVYVNGQFNLATIKAVQHVQSVLVPDGIWSWRSKADMQQHLGRPVTGQLGSDDIKALQLHVGATPDGSWGPQTTTRLQLALNDGGY